MKNHVNRELPEKIFASDALMPYAGAFARAPNMQRSAPKVKCQRPGNQKLRNCLEAIFDELSISNGMTLSFHHHFRNGDSLVNQVLAIAAQRGLKGLKIALSSVFPVHAPMIEHFKSGTVAYLDTDYMSGPVATAISQGVLAHPVMLRSHGGRARAIECGDLHIDVAFIAAPAADEYGNLNGTEGPTACGSLGYAFPDAEYADCVVAVTDTLLPYPLKTISISQTRVDYVVTLPSVGDPKGIVSGTTQVTKDPVQLKIASLAAKTIKASGLLKDGFSFQTGAGGASLAVAHYLRHIMREKSIVGSFALGGITGYLVSMLEEGLFERLVDVQGFDLDAVRSLKENPNHLEVSAGMYASPFNSGCMVNQLDCVVLGATEMDTQFNVNVVTGSNGYIMGGSGGHSDAAAGAKLTIVTANLIRGRLPILRDEIVTITTPGETVDVLVTEYGIAVNPRRQDLLDRLSQAGLPLITIEEMKQLAEDIAGVPDPIKLTDNIVALVEYRDGTVIDVVYQTVS
ncbi:MULTISPECIES: citrate lyase subunit alpha [Providencia]|uniref:citrate lyase subunit alpha n=1 Tax=Providencia TaxID=586 RepID=UPI001B37C1B1|nr:MULTISPECIES: citrate lyase subunit alpha [Providencia]MBQ0366255.1 citrate lyase subunit alpha [Providencia rettgeri]